MKSQGQWLQNTWSGKRVKTFSSPLKLLSLLFLLLFLHTGFKFWPSKPLPPLDLNWAEAYNVKAFELLRQKEVSLRSSHDFLFSPLAFLRQDILDGNPDVFQSEFVPVQDQAEILNQLKQRFLQDKQHQVSASFKEKRSNGKITVEFEGDWIENGYHGFLHHETFEAVDLRYGDGKVSLFIFLPDRESSLAAFSKKLNLANWKKWRDEFLERPGTVVVPPFEVRKQFFGFLHSADFYFKTRPRKNARFPLESVKQVVGNEDSFSFQADRPFFFAVVDNESDAIWFLGTYSPTSKS